MTLPWFWSQSLTTMYIEKKQNQDKICDQICTKRRMWVCPF